MRAGRFNHTRAISPVEIRADKAVRDERLFSHLPSAAPPRPIEQRDVRAASFSVTQESRPKNDDERDVARSVPNRRDDALVHERLMGVGTLGRELREPGARPATGKFSPL